NPSTEEVVETVMNMGLKNQDRKALDLVGEALTRTGLGADDLIYLQTYRVALLLANDSLKAEIGRASCREREKSSVVGVAFSSRRRHTRFSRDWSSDVCSSDLQPIDGGSGRDGHEYGP